MKTIHKKLQALLAMLLVVTFSFTLTGCEDDDDDNTTPTIEMDNIVEIAAGDQDFSLLVQALTKADLVSTLEGDGPFTVFAPNNAAFEQLLADLGVASLDDLTAAQLEPILLYHVVSGKVMSSDLTDGYVSTLSPGPSDTKVSVLVDAGNVVLNASSDVIQADIEAENGVIHVIDEVLLPPTVVDIAVDNGSFTSLVAALTKAELVETLSGDGPFTVFAPTDAAFSAFLDDLGVTLDDLTKEDLVPILQQHVVSGNVLSSDLSSGDVQTLNGTISIEVGDQVTINGNTTVTATDIQGKNGVVHVIDKVITPPQDIVDIASGDENFESLVAALTKAELVETLQGDGPFTVFAPTDDAFDQLLTDLGVASLDDLTAEQLTPILLYHVLNGKVMSTDLENGYVSTLSPGAIEQTNASLLVDADMSMLNGSTSITSADLSASNGVIHVIDEVLLPPNVVNIAQNNSNFSSLVDAVVKADLVETLSGDGPFTIFAPTDEAFAQLLNDMGATSLDDIALDDLVAILQKHVVSGNVLSSDLTSGDVTTLNGDISVEVGDGVTINGDINVTATDIQGTNGVVHVIDKVILPDIVEIAQGKDDFQSLVAALSKAELVETLQGDGPFTVFAPTDAAFEQLLTDLGLASLDDLTKEDLTPILLYHVLGAQVMSGDLTDGYVSTLSPGAEEGTNAALLVDAALAKLNGSVSITTTDIIASNGVIHVIDKVMLPNDVVDLAVNNSIFSSLVAAVTKAELVETLQGEGPFTIFAPTDAAFTAFLDDLGVTLDDLTKEDLVPILQYHVVSGNVTSDELSNGAVTTLNGDVTISVDNGVMVNDANVILADVQGTNGVVHAIDKVLVPEAK